MGMYCLCRACGRSVRLAAASLRHRGADEAPAAAAVAAVGRQRTSQGLHATAVQLADGNVLSTQRTGDIHRTSRVYA